MQERIRFVKLVAPSLDLLRDNNGRVSGRRVAVRCPRLPADDSAAGPKPPISAWIRLPSRVPLPTQGRPQGAVHGQATIASAAPRIAENHPSSVATDEGAGWKAFSKPMSRDRSPKRGFRLRIASSEGHLVLIARVDSLSLRSIFRSRLGAHDSKQAVRFGRPAASRNRRYGGTLAPLCSRSGVPARTSRRPLCSLPRSLDQDRPPSQAESVARRLFAYRGLAR